MEITRACISLSFNLRVMFLSFHIGFSLGSPGHNFWFESLSVKIFDLGHWKSAGTGSVICVAILLGQFVIHFVLSALISIPYLKDSSSSPAQPSLSGVGDVAISNASIVILSKKMLKSVGDGRHPWLTPVTVQNHSPAIQHLKKKTYFEGIFLTSD